MSLFATANYIQMLCGTDFLVPTVCVAGTAAAAAAATVAWVPGLWLCDGEIVPAMPASPVFPDLSISSKNGRCWGLTLSLIHI